MHNHFIRYPINRVVGTVADAGNAQAAIDALLRAGFEREEIDILHGEGDLRRLDPTAAGHGLVAQFQRKLIRALALEEFRHRAHHVEDVRAGRFVIMVLTRRRVMRMVASDILHQHGSGFVRFYGRWACEDLPATAQRLPEEVPASFVRAWNDRDPDALASLFDDDAEFVHVTGSCWHDRESIRKAYADRLGRALAASTLAIDETKVKLLSPEVAVVYARMTCSGEAPAGVAAQAGPRATIVSFVVHRAADRWRCTSAHSTDVIPDAETSVVR